MGTEIHPDDVIEYPDSDGKPMAENTLQYEWIVTLKGNIDTVFKNDPYVFVAGDNLIYAKRGSPQEVKAPDVYVAFGRPKGHRGSYKLWAEGNIFPQVIVEVLSPGNTDDEMAEKRDFYERYGAEEYYVIDPDFETLEVWLREGTRLALQALGEEFVSPRLGVRFEVRLGSLAVFKPTGERFLSFAEITERAEQEKARAEQERKRADRERAKARRERAKAEKAKAEAETERNRANAADARAEQLRAKLRALGIDPDAE